MFSRRGIWLEHYLQVYHLPYPREWSSASQTLSLLSVLTQGLVYSWNMSDTAGHTPQRNSGTVSVQRIKTHTEQAEDWKQLNVHKECSIPHWTSLKTVTGATGLFDQHLLMCGMIWENSALPKESEKLCHAATFGNTEDAFSEQLFLQESKVHNNNQQTSCCCCCLHCITAYPRRHSEQEHNSWCIATFQSEVFPVLRVLYRPAAADEVYR